MLVRSDLAVAVILGVLHSTANLCSAEPKITVVTQNLSWLENLVLEPTSNSMFVSELKFGRVWKIQMNSNQSYTRQLWISTNFTRILGLTKNLAVPRVIYGVGSQAGDDNVVFSASTIFPNNFTVIAHTPKGRVGNGFDCHYASGKLYTASEGDFLPGTGSVYEIDPLTGQVTTITESLWAADGLWIDQARHLLYVGQVANSKMLVWNISSQGGPAVSRGSIETGLNSVTGFMDDFTLNADGAAVVAASWGKSKIVQFGSFIALNLPQPSLGLGISVLVGNGTIHQPTSARWGESSDPHSAFPASALFVTEGRAKDYLLPQTEKNSRLLRIDF